MNQPPESPTPGWYPDPAGTGQQRYWDGTDWGPVAPPPSSPPPPVAPPVVVVKKKRSLLSLIVLGGLVLLAGSCISSALDRDGGKDSSKSSSRPSAAPASPTSKTPNAWEYMAGNGTHQMGGVDGKNWGEWVSDGTTGVVAGGTCTWSIRSVAQDRPGIVLDQGEAPSGEKVRVVINPDGDGSSDGTIGEDNHRIVFMTNNCGAWKPI